MKTTYIRKLKSGNYEISNRDNYTEKLKTKKDVIGFFNRISNEIGTYNSRLWKFNKARVVKSRYSKSQTYFQDANEFYNNVK